MLIIDNAYCRYLGLSRGFASLLRDSFRVLCCGDLLRFRTYVFDHDFLFALIDSLLFREIQFHRAFLVSLFGGSSATQLSLFRSPRWRRPGFDCSNLRIPVLSIFPSCLKSLERIGFPHSTPPTRTTFPQR